MEGARVTAIVFGTVLLVTIIVGFVLYSLFCYKKWKISTENQRKQFKLNKLFSSFELCCSGSTREASTPSLNVPQVTVDQQIEHTRSRTNSGGLVSTGVAYDNKKLCVAVIEVNASDVDLQLPQSPIRKSAETYSIVDLHEDT